LGVLQKKLTNITFGGQFVKKHEGGHCGRCKRKEPSPTMARFDCVFGMVHGALLDGFPAIIGDLQGRGVSSESGGPVFHGHHKGLWGSKNKPFGWPLSGNCGYSVDPGEKITAIYRRGQSVILTPKRLSLGTALARLEERAREMAGGRRRSVHAAKNAKEKRKKSPTSCHMPEGGLGNRFSGFRDISERENLGEGERSVLCLML